MSEYKGYTKSMGAATAKYKKANRQQICLDVAMGVKDVWKKKAEKRGMSLTAYISWLIENDNDGEV